ncbi:MAG TPA: aldo/keto reductase [Polyangiaceae bacterium]|jgi:aryl-alcohol dehydrogenase-like predicted oxidoreductase
MLQQLAFGRTGHQSSRVIFGAAALGTVTQAEADAALDLLLEHGVNHIDTAASYGESERRIGPWLATRRAEFFLATKTGERSYAKAKEQLHRSLELLRTDHLDLIQLHCLIDEQDWTTAMGPGGALEALVEARAEGLVRFIGVTGHELRVARMHQRSLAHFDFDSVLLPLNYSLLQNPAYESDFEALLGICAARNIAVQTIKSVARGPKEDQAQPWHTWYAPLTEPAAIAAAVHWVLGDPRVFLNTPGDIRLLPSVLEAAARFTAQPSDQVMQEQARANHVSPLFV